MPLATLLMLLPTLFWDQPADTAAALREAGIQRMYVPTDRVETWRKLGFSASPFDRAQAARATTPKVEYHIDVASATRVPWVDANGWRFERPPARAYFYDVPAGSAALAAAEAYTYGAEAAIRAAQEDLPAFGRMLRFLTQIGQPRLPAKANIGVIDDGSEVMSEVLNLMARHNLLFHVIRAPDSKYDVNIRLGGGEYGVDYSREDAANPYEFAMKIRRRLTDEKRLVRIYGSNVVLVHLEGEGSRARLHLLNYGGAAVRGLRLRVLGAYRQGKVAAFEHADAALGEYSVEDNATEFTVSQMGTYAVVDLW